jgi:lipopolysaccharide export system permease protein
LLWLAVPLAAIVAWIAMDVGPRALSEVERIAAEARRAADLSSIEPGRFTEIGSADAVVYGESVSAGGVMHNVFMQRRGADGSVEVVVAEQGEQIVSDDPDARMLVLTHGRRYEGVPGTTQFRVVEFREHGIPFHLPGLETAEPLAEARPLAALLGARDVQSMAELQWRLSVPIATLLLAFIAVPLSRSQPRDGRYGRLAIGLLIFIVYFNLLSAAKAWLESGQMPPALGLWWVHGGLLALGLAMLAAQNGLHRRLFR